MTDSLTSALDIFDPDTVDMTHADRLTEHDGGTLVSGGLMQADSNKRDWDHHLLYPGHPDETVFGDMDQGFVQPTTISVSDTVLFGLTWTDDLSWESGSPVGQQGDDMIVQLSVEVDRDMMPPEQGDTLFGDDDTNITVTFDLFFGCAQDQNMLFGTDPDTLPSATYTPQGPDTSDIDKI